VEQVERQRDLAEHRGEYRRGLVPGAPVQDDVEPRVADQQRAGEDARHDHDLPPPPRRPRGEQQPEDQERVEPDPGRGPLLGGMVVWQDVGQIDDPRHHHRAPAGDDGQEQLAQMPQVRVVQVW